MDKLYVNEPTPSPRDRRCPSPNPGMEEQRLRQAKLTELSLSMNEAYTPPKLTKGIKVKKPLRSGTSVSFMRADRGEKASTMIVSDNDGDQVLLCGPSPADGSRSYQKLLMWKVVPYGVTSVDDDVIAVVLGSPTFRTAGVKTKDATAEGSRPIDTTPTVRLVSSSTGDTISSWGSEFKDWHPRGIALTRQGNVVITNVHPHASNRLTIYSLDGREVVTFGRSHGPADLSFNTPNHVSVDVFDRVLATDTENNCVKIFDIRGAYVGQFGDSSDFKRGGGAASSEGVLDHPEGICCDSNGNVYVCDSGHYRLAVFAHDGRFVRSYPITRRGALHGTVKQLAPLAIATNTKENSLALTMSDVGGVFRKLQVYKIEQN